jgi:methylthioribose-1-phosphate isomerase
MLVNGKNYQTIWMKDYMVRMIDQNALPFEFKIFTSRNYKETCHAIKTMLVRGAGAIGAAAGFAMAQAAIEADARNYSTYLQAAREEIEATRPTARNLFAATGQVYQAALNGKDEAIKAAKEIARKDKEDSKRIGELGNQLIKDGFRIETHCNAGWLAFVDHGTALSPIYMAKKSGKRVFVYVDETRPRSQGARLTAWELLNESIPHAIIPDNAGAHLMSKGLVDMVIVGADRIALNGDVANKIGTLEKAIAAQYFQIPFYVAAPLSTFDIACKSGQEIVIEERSPDEVLFQTGIDKSGNLTQILVAAPNAQALNPAFDITPADLITGIITEVGIIKPQQEHIEKLFLRQKTSFE